MPMSRGWRKALITVVIVLGGGGLVVRSMLNQQSWHCEVCMAFQDAESCSGHKRDEAMRTALDLACSDIAPGMANGIACTNSPPLKVVCKER
jgi:hypothetical protein